MVAAVQYGGKITDNNDIKLFKSYTEAWVSPYTLAPNFSFNPESPINRIPNDFTYSIPDCQEVEAYVAFIQSFPDVDSPEVFGLHPNADLTCEFERERGRHRWQSLTCPSPPTVRNKEVQGLLNTIIETQPVFALSSRPVFL